MKALLLIASFVFLTNCGLQNQVNELREKSNQAENRLAQLEKQTAKLESARSDNSIKLANLLLAQQQLQQSVSTLTTQLVTLQQSSQANSNDVASLQLALNTAQTQVTALQVQTLSLQVAQNNILIQLATLQGYSNIVAIKDPCGNQVGADEVFLKLSTGQYLASFSENSSGKNTRFSLLYDGTFNTTDATGCVFTVSSGGTIISNEHN